MSESMTVASLVGGRAVSTVYLKSLHSPEEGGTKKEYEDFLNKIESHVSINWEFGQDMAYMIKHTIKPVFEEPNDLTDEEEKVKWKLRLWNQNVDRYGKRLTTMEDNMGEIFL